MILSNSSFKFYAKFNRVEKQTFDLPNIFPRKKHVKQLRTAESFDLNIFIAEIKRSEVYRIWKSRQTKLRDDILESQGHV